MLGWSLQRGGTQEDQEDQLSFLSKRQGKTGSNIELQISFKGKPFKHFFYCFPKVKVKENRLHQCDQ